MDELAYVAMTGAKQIALAQSVNSHNLANVNTVGFRADLHEFDSLPVNGATFASRVNANIRDGGWSNSQGELMTTGNPMDIAVSGEGWLTVQAPDGTEAYSKAGDLRVNALGMLTNGNMHPVIGEGGPIAVPPHSSMTIGADGTISIIPLGQGAETSASVDRLKLVKPERTELVKGEDGLMRMADGSSAPTDASLSVTTGALEASNVNAIGAMVSMIELARQFELQIKMINTADENAQSAASVMRMG